MIVKGLCEHCGKFIEFEHLNEQDFMDCPWCNKSTVMQIAKRKANPDLLIVGKPGTGNQLGNRLALAGLLVMIAGIIIFPIIIPVGLVIAIVGMCIRK